MSDLYQLTLFLSRIEDLIHQFRGKYSMSPNRIFMTAQDCLAITTLFGAGSTSGSRDLLYVWGLRVSLKESGPMEVALVLEGEDTDE